jgi:hypothetical protein
MDDPAGWHLRAGTGHRRGHRFRRVRGAADHAGRANGRPGRVAPPGRDGSPARTPFPPCTRDAHPWGQGDGQLRPRPSSPWVERARAKECGSRTDRGSGCPRRRVARTHEPGLSCGPPTPRRATRPRRGLPETRAVEGGGRIAVARSPAASMSGATLARALRHPGLRPVAHLGPSGRERGRWTVSGRRCRPSASAAHDPVGPPSRQEREGDGLARGHRLLRRVLGGATCDGASPSPAFPVGRTGQSAHRRGLCGSVARGATRPGGRLPGARIGEARDGDPHPGARQSVPWRKERAVPRA